MAFTFVDMAGYSNSEQMHLHHRKYLISPISSPISIQMLASMSTSAPQFYVANSKGSNPNRFIPLVRTDFNIFQDPSLRVVRFREEMPEFSPTDSRIPRNRKRFYLPYPTSSQEASLYRTRGHQVNSSRYTNTSSSVPVVTHPRIVSRAGTPRISIPTRADASRAVPQVGSPHLPPINESRIPRAEYSHSPPANDLEVASEISTVDEELSGQNEDGTFVEKIPKPEGEAGRPNRGGYNLSHVLNWQAQEFEEIRVRVLATVLYQFY